MEHLVITKQISHEVLILSLNRPEKRNALNIPLLKAFTESLEEAKKMEGLRVIIIKGEGPVFCSGLDLKEALDEGASKMSNRLLCQLFKELYETPFVTIAAVQGAAIAGGAGIMSACHFVIAEKEAKFGFPEVQRGLVAAEVMVFLNKQLRQRDLFELLLLGDLFDAKKALSMGLINKIVENEKLVDEAISFSHKLLKCAPKALRKTRELIDTLTGIVESDLDRMCIESELMRGTCEAKEGMNAFLEHREPKFHS